MNRKSAWVGLHSLFECAAEFGDEQTEMDSGGGEYCPLDACVLVLLDAEGRRERGGADSTSSKALPFLSAMGRL